MRGDGSYEFTDDDDIDAVSIEDATGVERAVPQRVVFEIALSDPGPATELAREAAAMGYEVEMRRPDDAEGYFEISCATTIAAEPAEIARARQALEALAEELGCIAEDDPQRD